MELESEIPYMLYRKAITNFLEVMILTSLRNQPMSGYDVISFAHRKFRILLSPGTVYSSLYSLERSGLVKGVDVHGKRIYALTRSGKEAVRSLSMMKDRLLGLISSLFIGQ